jgi:hypothetical protein
MNCPDCELYGPCQGRHGCAAKPPQTQQGFNCPARPASVTRVKVSHCTRAETEPVIPQPAPALRAPIDDELPASKWDLLWFWGTVSVTGVCTLVVTVGGLGWVYGKYMA